MIKRRKSNKRRKNLQAPSFRTLIVGAVLLGAVLGLGIIRLAASTDPQIPGVAQTTSSSSMEFTVISATELPARHAMNPTPSKDEKGLIMRISVKNRTQKSQPFLPANQLFIKSRDGMIYQMRPVTGVSDPIEAGNIPSGESLEGEVSFIVDKTAEQLHLFVDSRWDSEPPIVIEIPS